MSPRIVLAVFIAILSVLSGVDALTTNQPTCKAGSYLVSNTLGAACPIGRTYTAAITGVGSCCACARGTSGPKCDLCAPAVSTTSSTPSGVDTNADPAGGCKCQPGYASYNPTTKTCTRCPVNTASDGTACRSCAVIKQVTNVNTNNWYAAPGSATCTQIICNSNAALNMFMPDGGYAASHCRPCDATSTSGLLYPSVCKCKAGWGNFAVVTDASGAVRGTCTQCTGNTVSSQSWPAGTTGTGIVPQRCASCTELYQGQTSYFPNTNRDGCINKKPTSA